MDYKFETGSATQVGHSGYGHFEMDLQLPKKINKSTNFVVAQTSHPNSLGLDRCIQHVEDHAEE